ncbi:hypothetical protein ABV409_15175 [Flagellimonas sp. DF-77]|uniref:hypothetical protein n=1 Tax=Flagellimonas algarum TaxID=3230298 RepID=UPI003397FD0D
MGFTRYQSVLRGGLFWLLGILAAQAQLEALPLGDGVTIDRLYAGLHAQTAFWESTADRQSPSSFRAGALVSLWVVPEQLKFRSFGVVDLRSGRAINTFESFELQWVLHPKWTLKVGRMATPTTELRPNPTTWQSQVETETEAQLIGGRRGAKLHHQWGPQASVTYGFYDHGGGLFHHLQFKKGAIALTGYTDGKSWLTAARWDGPLGHYVGVLSPETLAFSAIVPVRTHYQLVVDMGYGLAENQLDFGHWGLRRSFRSEQLGRGFFSLMFDRNTETLQGGFFLHL